ncbi:MAG TPA: hypothetical protein VFV28_08190 [Limnobacter sp.]|nr:hypothetical protein [Limnobacter sp.]
MKLQKLVLLPLLAVTGHSLAQGLTESPAQISSAQAEEQPNVPRLDYESAFQGYRTYSDPELQSWPQMIKQVEEIGGWRVYAREPQEKSMDSTTANPSKGNPAKAHDHSTGGKP